MSAARSLSMAVAASVVLALVPSVQAKGGPTFTYTVKPGDSCFSIAKRFLGSGAKYTHVHKHNPQLGAMPHVLEPGQKLKLPGSRKGPDALVAWLRKDVKARPPRTGWRRARVNMDLWRLYRVSTGDESAARIAFEEDTSRLHLRQNALLVIYGASAKLAARKTAAPKTNVVLEKGVVRGGLDALDQRAGLTVKTPAATVDLATRDAQIEVDKKKASSVSVYDGKADVSARGATVEVPKDFGTRVEKGKKPPKPRPLPPRVKWEAEGDAIVLVPSGERGSFEARWKSVKRAKRYRVELARDARFRRIIVDAVVGSGVLKFRADDLEPGAYYARVAAIDSWRLQGRASKKLKVTIGAIASSKRLNKTSTPGLYHVAGLLRLAAPKSLSDTLEIAVDDGAFAVGPVRLAKPRTYKIRMRMKGSKVETRLAVRVLALKATMTLKPRGIGPINAGNSFPIEVIVEDELGQPVAPPGLQLWTSAQTTGDVVLKGVGRGTYRASLDVSPDAPTQKAVVRLAWAGGELARESFDIRGEAKPALTPQPEPEAPGFDWPLGVDAASSWRRGSAASLRTHAPLSRVGLHTGLAQVESAAADSTLLRLTVAGELAVLDRAFGVGLALPFYVSDVAGDPVGTSELGDLRVHARGVAYADEVLSLLATGALTFPTAGDVAGTTQGGLTAGLVLRVTPTSWFDLDTTQSFGLWSDFDAATDMAWDGTLGLTFRPIDLLSLGLRFDVGASLTTPEGVDSWLALGLAGHVAVRLGRFRLGVFVAGGLNDDAKAREGAVSGGLSLDVGFEGLE